MKFKLDVAATTYFEKEDVAHLRHLGFAVNENRYGKPWYSVDQRSPLPAVELHSLADLMSFMESVQDLFGRGYSAKLVVSKDKITIYNGFMG